MHDHAIANDTDGLGVKDTRGNEMQGVFIPGLIIDSVSRISPALREIDHDDDRKAPQYSSVDLYHLSASNDVILLRQNVHQFALSLVAPLGPKDNGYLGVKFLGGCPRRDKWRISLNQERRLALTTAIEPCRTQTPMRI